MTDRHVRRSGDEYRDAFLALLPNGQAWPKHAIDSVLWQACDGLNQYWGTVDGRAADLLERESNPGTTIELLPDWERNWGLPDPCYTAPLTIGERQQALLLRMTIQGAQSRDFFISVADYIGYTIHITEFRPFRVGMDRCGDNRTIGNGLSQYDEWGRLILTPGWGVSPVPVGQLSEWPNYGCGGACIYYWTVHVGASKLVWFRCASGQCGVDPHLRIGLADDLECLLNRWKPAHTRIVFDYSGLTSPGDPFAGTGGDLEGNNIHLQADQGSYAATGRAATLKRNKDINLQASPGSYVAAGNAATLQYLPAATTTAALDPSTALAAIVSGGGLIGTSAGTASSNSGVQAFASAGKSMGKFYFEATLLNITSTSLGGTDGFGVIAAGSAYTSAATMPFGGAYLFPGSGIASNGAGRGSLGGGLSGTAVFSCAVDVTNRLIWFRAMDPSPGPWNGPSVNGNPETGVGGFPLPGGSMVPVLTFGGPGGQPTEQISLNLGATAFAGPVPTGFTAGWPA